MSVEEGLSSEDATVIKKARGAAKGVMSNLINRLPDVLPKGTAGKLLYEKISDSEVLALTERIEKSHETLQTLHVRFGQFRDLGKDALEEKNLDEAEAAYGQEVWQKYRSAIAEIEVYKNEKNVVEIEEAIAALKTALDFDKYVSSEIVDKKDPEMIKSAPASKICLKTSFDVYANKMADLRKAMKVRGDKKDVIDKACDYVEEGKAVHKLIALMDAVITSLLPSNIVEEKVKADAPSGINDGAAPVQSVNKPSVVKLQKMTSPQFSGHARDFAQFKRDFSSVVAVPGRSSVDIGYNLMNAIPAKHQHLIRNIDLSNHEEMMGILTDKFGCSWLVVEDVVSQIEKIKVVTTDRGFIDFAEKIEKIQRDLDALGITGEVANSTVIGKLESKLPTNIYIDWSKVVTKEKLNKKTSDDKFKEFMAFLKESKERIEYMTSDSRQASGGTAKSVTQVNFVTGVTLVGRTAATTEQPVGVRKERNWRPCLACNVDAATNLSATLHPEFLCSLD